MQLVARCIADEIASAAPRKTLGVLEHVRLVVYSIQTEKNAFVQALKLSKADISALEAGKSSSTTLGAVKVTDAQNTFDLDFPTTWAPMVSGAYAAIGRRLRGGSEALFSERKDATENLTYCIQNPTLYLQYQLEKTIMEKQYTGKRNYKSGMERRLYHGTEEATVPKICTKGFDRSYNGKNAVKFGRFAYFAKGMSYSVLDLYSKPSPVAGQKYSRTTLY